MSLLRYFTIPVSPVGQHEATPDYYLLDEKEVETVADQIENVNDVAAAWNVDQNWGRVHGVTLTPMPGRFVNTSDDLSSERREEVTLKFEEATRNPNGTTSMGVVEVSPEAIEDANADHAELEVSPVPKESDRRAFAVARGRYDGFASLYFESKVIEATDLPLETA